MNEWTRRDFMRITGLSAAALAAGPILEACGAGSTPSTSPTAVIPKSVARIRLAGSATLFGFPSPFAMTRGPGFIGMSYLFDQLLWDTKQGTVPWLAQSYAWENGNTAITFKLRPGATFSDGTALTADDVVFSYELIKAKPMPWTINTGLITSATAVDAHTVRMVLQGPNAAFIDSDMASMPIIPKHIWSDHQSDPYHFLDPSALIGSGPYTLRQFDASTGSYQFVANDKYVMGKPVVHEVDYVPVSDVLLALQGGTIDAGSPSTSMGIGADALQPFKSSSKFGVLTGPSDVMTALYFNIAAGAPYNDPKFRQAVAYAINRKDLVSRVLQGSGDVGNPGWLSRSSPWYNANVPAYAYNVSTARAMLDSAGYTLPSGATVRQTPGGGQLVLPVVFDSSNPSLVQVLQSQLQQVGIQLEPHGLDFASLRSTATQGKYSLALITLGGLGGDPDFVFQSFNSQAPPGVQNFTFAHGYTNAQMSSLELQQRATLNRTQRKSVVDHMQQLVATDLPALSLVYQPNIWIYNKQVFDAWYFTPGGVAGGTPTATNKAVLVTGHS